MKMKIHSLRALGHMLRPSAATLFTSTLPSRTFIAPTRHQSAQKPTPMIEDDEQGFGFIRHNPRAPKPRTTSVTEIRGPYYSAMGTNYLRDLLDTMGHHIDGLKFAGGSFSLFPEEKLRELINLAHHHDVYVSTGGWIEHILTQSNSAGSVERYIEVIKRLGFDVVELSTGFISLPSDDWLRLVDKVHAAGLIAKPEIGIQFGAGGDTESSDLVSLGQSDPSKMALQRMCQVGGQMWSSRYNGNCRWRTPCTRRRSRKCSIGM
ncbi:(2R)-phospho-3-sulfolactate synthase [Verticillium dahliae VdLs.17]|uniref:(2R)-phospho-3-sulfolactate synthase n=1 Tax=Verticillium dahliae (strain VdLs.17 / ATCC MYA-4575 / FGSC 10137) TaxID=498257 RepID=G2WXT1_VERDV|nr:(2R)-phospho-3-sulfolactate synthase [Verticillium dahliae VdLs.17]EGY20889.1 (2R)-phospho-3-sulfolactate synthase [Verticillium dahliae VdLs.17]